MPDWTSSDLLSLQAAAYQKMTLVFVGICMYDFANTISYDWMLLVGTDMSRRSALARTVKWLYLACRYTNLATSICLAMLSTARGRISCATLLRMLDIFGVLTANFSTTLLFIRVGAIWAWDKRITLAFFVAFPVSIALGVRSMVTIQSSRTDVTIGPICDMSDVSIDMANVIALLIVDLGVLGLMFTGLRRWKDLQGILIWQLLRDQSLVYLTLAIALEVPMMVFLILDYNQYMIMFFTTLDIILLPLATTQFYRSLTSFPRRHNGYAYESNYAQSIRFSKAPPGFRMSVELTDLSEG
ncbi:unnamed protein product [Peniophora sp. CBMAI 1063]|nr:unnamed protein product [Peniophora sp. CBMAI 1063]